MGIVLKKTNYLVTLVALLIMLMSCDSGIPQSGGADSSTNQAAGSFHEENSNAEVVKLKIFTQYTMEVDEKQPFDYAYTKMKLVMPEVELEIDIEPQDDSSKLKIYAASGILPDIIQVTPGIITLFRKSDNLLVLDQYVKDTGIESRVQPAYKSLLWSEDGHSYAIPRTAPSTQLLFYNKEVFSNNDVKVPIDYDGFLAAIKIFNSKGITPLAIFARETWPGVMLYEDFITRYEPQGLMKISQGKSSLLEEPYKKAANQVFECVKAGLLAPDAFTTDYDTAFAKFTSGKAAMFLNGCWALSPLGEIMGDNVDYMDFPLSDAQTVQATLMNRPGGGFDGGYSVSANTKYKDVAGKYTCLFSLEIANGRVLKAGAPNPLTVDGVAPEKGYPEISRKYAEQALNYQTTSVFPWALDAKISVILGDNCAKLLTGAYPVDRFIKDTDNEIKKVLN